MLGSAERVELGADFKGNSEGTEIRAKAATLRNQSVAAAFESLSPPLPGITITNVTGRDAGAAEARQQRRL